MNRLYSKILRDENLINHLLKIAEKNNFSIYYSNSKYPKNLNIWGIRSNDTDTKKYNDVMITFYSETSGWKVNVFEITTDPSNLNLIKPINKKGTAILVEGQYKGLWKIGKHKNQYEALVQNKPCKVYRDNNKDEYLNFKNDSIEEGMFGINCHRASSWKISELIGLYAAGCQVHKDVNRFNKEFMPLVKKCCINEKTDSFTYTLINENMYLEVL